MPSILVTLLGAGGLHAQCDRFEDQKLFASNGFSFDEFFRTAIDGDVVVVGAAQHDNGAGPKSGSAYVYRRTGGSGPEPWTFEQELQHPTPAARDFFGGSCAVDGDWILVGATDDDTTAKNAGSVFAFQWDGSSWVLREQIQASNPQVEDYFGDSIAVRNGLLVASTPERSVNASVSGSVHVFRFDPNLSVGQQWVFEQELSSAGVQEFEGTKVATDGVRILTGAPGEMGAQPTPGHAFVYAYDPTQPAGQRWVLEQTLAASDGANVDQFGYDAAIDGDFVCVGAPGHDVFGSEAGACYVYEFDGAQWAERQKIVPSDVMANDEFGVVLSARRGFLTVGSFSSAQQVGAGAGYVYVLRNGTYEFQQKLVARDAETGDALAWPATDGNTVMLGAVWGDGTSLDSGAVYAYGLGDLALSTNLDRPVQGDALEFHTCAGRPGGVVLLYVVQVDQTKILLRITTGVFDANGSHLFGAIVPPGLSGIDAAFLAFGSLAPKGTGVSNPVWVRFQ